MALAKSAPAPAPARPTTLPQAVAASTIAVMLATLASMLLGFAREVVNARYFGEAWEYDAFIVAAIIPTLVFGVFNGALVSALVPVFSEYFAAKHEEDAWRLSSTVINVLFFVLLVAAALGWLAAPWIVRIVAIGFPPDHLAETVRMTRILMPTIIATSIAGVVQAVLNAQQRYRAAALQGIALNVLTVVAVLAFFRQYGIYALVFGYAAGLVAQLLVQVPSFLRRSKYRFVIDLKHPGITALFVILGPIIVGSAVGQVNLLVDKYFASSLPAGAISAMNYATKLVGFPQQLFAVAIATVIFPILSAQFATRETAALRETASTGLRMTTLITIPAAAMLIVLAQPILSVLFERGAFTYGDVVRTAGALQYYAVGLLGIAASIVLTRCFFAMRDSRTPVIVAIGVMAQNIVLSALLVGPYGVNGLAISNSASSLTEALVLFWLLHRRIGPVDEGGDLIGSCILRVSIASFAMAGAALVVHRVLWHPAGTLFQHAATLTAALVTGGVVFLAVGAALRVRELAMLLAMAADYVERRAASAAAPR
ncbi:MAG TPA: murein biosynthesis integral membrane protein MurJ [Candidatus Eremiobacteraceae bacterium]|nr:murein biosynthesis integral membrane protein MurJ [Candidatus Eremiobacteraceae bacterium]